MNAYLPLAAPLRCLADGRVCATSFLVWYLTKVGGLDGLVGLVGLGWGQVHVTAGVYLD